MVVSIDSSNIYEVETVIKVVLELSYTQKSRADRQKLMLYLDAVT